MNSENMINAVKAQNFDLIVKSVKGAKDDPTTLLQLIDNLSTSVAFLENAIKATGGN